MNTLFLMRTTRHKHVSILNGSQRLTNTRLQVSRGTRRKLTSGSVTTLFNLHLRGLTSLTQGLKMRQNRRKVIINNSGSNVRYQYHISTISRRDLVLRITDNLLNGLLGKRQNANNARSTNRIILRSIRRIRRESLSM